MTPKENNAIKAQTWGDASSDSVWACVLASRRYAEIAELARLMDWLSPGWGRGMMNSPMRQHERMAAFDPMMRSSALAGGCSCIEEMWQCRRAP